MVGDIAAMGAEARIRAGRVADQMSVGLGVARMGASEWAEAVARMNERPVPWMSAVPGVDPPGTRFRSPYPPPAKYSALATDGSHIPVDRHAITPCYLINVGEIALHYGTGERPLLRSRATLHYRDDEIYSGTPTGDLVPLSERVVTNRRLLAESGALAVLIAENFERAEPIALVDAPLIVWTPTGEKELDQKKVIDEFCEMLKAGMQCHVPVAGYVSRPGHRDVVGLLRRVLCTDGCGHGPAAPCRALAHLADAHLYAGLLPTAGDRSPVFESAAPNLEFYAPDQKIRFFYLNTGAEIARVEVPAWVSASPKLLDRVQVLVRDQSMKGQGYPVALAEAHERAVVRGPDRNAFFQLVEQSLIRHDVPVQITRKALSKRTRML
ncbi:MAG: DNA double-strand break repair nuclease NurA [Capsulimonadaceae bacterium]